MTDEGNIVEGVEEKVHFYGLEKSRRFVGILDRRAATCSEGVKRLVEPQSHNRIFKIETAAGETIELQYDALGRRVYRDNGDLETVYLWWGDQETSEHESGAGQPVIQNAFAFAPLLPRGKQLSPPKVENGNAQRHGRWAHPTALNTICARAVEGDKNEIEYYHKNYLDHVYAVSDDNGNLSLIHI